ncbi:MAG: CpaF family protein [Agathobacter sp.]|nr:CpaF family protein [Agathobacter sp.]
MEQLCERIRSQVLEQLDFSRELEDVELQELIAKEMSHQKDVDCLSIQQRVFVEQRVFNSLRKLDVLQELLEDDTITEIMVNGPNHIFYEKNGQFWEHPYHFASEEKLQDVVQQIVGKHNRVVNLTSPIVDTRLEDGSRVNIVLMPIAIDGSAISIRKFGKDPIDMQALISFGTLNQEVAEFLKQIVVARYNIFISGGTSSGKTTFLNALSAFIPPNERVITIEDSAELQLQQTPNLVRLETRNRNQEGVNEISARELIHTALRMRPDRIIVGECRGEETLDMLQAMNTGHDGSLSTGHGNSIRDMISRLEMMVLMGNELPLQAIRQQIAMGIDIMIHLERGRDHRRRVVEIAEVVDVQDGEILLNPLYQYQDGLLRKVGEVKMRR